MAFLLFLQLLLLPLTLAFPSHYSRDAVPVRPLNDSFYTPPVGYESTAPGTILRSRTPPYPISAFSLAKVNIAAAHQLLYRTTDTFGNASATVSTILVPHNADYTKLLSYQVAEDASNPNCAPSYAFQLHSAAEDGPLGLVMPQLELVFIASALEKGWVVTVPDHLGPKGTFLANTMSGHAVLDGIRAAKLSSNFTHIADHPTISLWGYSGGSLASGFAAELQPSYAPELDIAGAALGGTVPRILPVIEAANKSPFAGLIPSGIQGLANEYPVIQKLIEENIVPEKMAEFEKVKHLCLTGDIFQFFGQDVYNYTRNRDIFTQPDAAKVMDANAMGQKTPKIPLFVYKSAGDEISPVNDTDTLVQNYCSNGATVEYKRDILSEHAAMDIVGAPDAMIWLNERMNRQALKPGCSNSTSLTSLTDPGALGALGVGVVDTLLDLLGKPVGPFQFGI
ncbi:hypothetical protein ASPWEDRAFT_55432 [Aspergillus wentii DTO 134E9]|uniref:Secretory lipase-domain-containing protein n=1 Tax=Aspergillus wentii DTO 134E9 TaxID=1073089 RepID=A0A1L9R4R2_ASPWE|nr:uncharacterized protein ASPWEDRAFT_55432 [Aspergillus wentii DTO 134E9]KAI9927183.1 hypothetical protein MW887_003567 [Aspergillus wentii]OJJ29911.1 hypothetical protein ASPWEDRAFT_55432 [Aspergillus wentii DTO 134E9]